MNGNSENMDIIKTIDIVIWERNFSLPVIYDCYEGEIITAQQIEVVKNFVAHKDWVANSKIKVEKFCKADVMADDDNHSKDNIFSYVKPHYLFIKRDEVGARVFLICKYRYNEDGLEIIFESDGTAIVGLQE